jgi:orotidine-5'-phosphate decarboxylase
MKEKIIIALDFSSRQQALHLVKELHDSVGMFKVGSQLFTACGPDIVRDINRAGGKVFLDLKFHDIPNQVTQAAVEAAKLGVAMITVHASGGRAMMQSVSRELQNKFSAHKPTVVAITVLTSFDTRGLFEIGIEVPVEEQVERLARFAEECGMDGIVCSPQEIQQIRKLVSPHFKIVTPGIRMPDQSVNDQQRVATAQDAFAAGADYIVVGRPVTEAADRQEAVQRLVQST